MAHIQPFKAIRPTRNKVAFVASRSYEAYAPEELQSVLKYNPFSFLHVLDPGFTIGKNLPSTERFQKVYNRYQEFLVENIFHKEEETCFYLYQVEKEQYKALGFFCACSIEDYQNDVIKKHEDTLHVREQLMADYLYTVGFNAEPVLIAYPDCEAVNQILQKETLHAPEYNFVTADGANHTLWKIADPKTLAQLKAAFNNIEALYIADGHHRSASSYITAQRMKAENPSHTGKEAYNFFMACLVPESQIKMQDFTRMVKNLNGHTKDAFLAQLAQHFHIEKKEDTIYPPTQKHSFGMYLAGGWYTLHLKEDRYAFTDALSTLDAQILYKTILEPLLGIKDLRNNANLVYGCGNARLTNMKAHIDAGEFAVGFSLTPVNIDEMKAIADARLVMPPKSTYIEPKLLSGLAIYELCQRETLKPFPSRYI